ncbi:unnamed protein product [Darwinula stevensoni]|uniref:DNA polymerase eta n=1 Tax=Darwinula stevensoni TaxID=69355 RepID=A0A7R9AA29_9CRUS|nr:unnamed protein product [Darwinula stevensoni]CAG0897784.1 unnamed protein product [Darwinula stevensoni]
MDFNYEARAKGVTRMMMGDDAKAKCPEIHLFRVPELRGKADLTKYRDAGREVIEVLTRFTGSVERASIDEAYIDLTEMVKVVMTESCHLDHKSLPSTFVVGYDEDDSEEGRRKGLMEWLANLDEGGESIEEDFEVNRCLALAAIKVEEMRKAIFEQTGFRCSAGISFNKVLSKLGCGLHKPNKQTVVPVHSIRNLFEALPVRKVRNLGGKLGKRIEEELGCATMGQLAALSEQRLQVTFDEKIGSWLYLLAQGIDQEPVQSRQLPKSIDTGKFFRGPDALVTYDKVWYWVQQMAAEVSERLKADQERLSNSRDEAKSPPITSLGLHAGNFEPFVMQKTTMKNFLLKKHVSVAGENEEAQSQLSHEQNCENEGSPFKIPTTSSTAFSSPSSSLRATPSVPHESIGKRKLWNFQQKSPDIEGNDIRAQIREIFPDLTAIDDEVLALLPLRMQAIVQEEIQKSRAAVGECCSMQNGGLWKYLKRDRIIVLVDMDCFYVQVEERLKPEVKGKPAVVVQYRAYKGGGIIAVNYEARALGINRGMMGDEARAKCPEVHLFRVPEVRGKAELTRYRDAGRQVIQVLAEFSGCVERASVDEAYIDLTEEVEKRLKQEKLVTAGELSTTFVVGWESEEDETGVARWLNSIDESSSCSDTDRRLAIAAHIVEEMRRAILEKTSFKCSAGISHNKMLSKLACGLHKPNQQTVLPMASVCGLWEKTLIHKVRNLGGKLGQMLEEEMNCKTMGDLSKLSEKELQNKTDDKTGSWLYGLGRGIDNEPVTDRHLPQSIACGKFFRGRESLTTAEEFIYSNLGLEGIKKEAKEISRHTHLKECMERAGMESLSIYDQQALEPPKILFVPIHSDLVQFWVSQLADEVSERLIQDQEMNKRRAKTLTLMLHMGGDNPQTVSRSSPLTSYEQEAISRIGYNAALRFNKSTKSAWNPPVTGMFLTASKFEEESKQAGAIQKFLQRKEHMPDDEILPVVKSEVLKDTMTLKLSGEALKSQVASSSSSKFGHDVEAGTSFHDCTPARQASGPLEEWGPGLQLLLPMIMFPQYTKPHSCCC